jgi:hypothetical protein
MQSLSYHYDIELSVLDAAVAEGSLACFSHWQAKLTPRWQGQYSSMGPSLESVEAAEGVLAASSSNAAGPSQQQQQASSGEQSGQQDGSMLVDGMAVDLFNENMQLKVSVVWMPICAGCTLWSLAEPLASLHGSQLCPASCAAKGMTSEVAMTFPCNLLHGKYGLQGLAVQKLIGGHFTVLMVAPLHVCCVTQQVIWVFRGPVMPQERHLFLEYDKQLAAAEAALAASEQEAIRQERRQQREQQVCVCWHDLQFWAPLALLCLGIMFTHGLLR